MRRKSERTATKKAKASPDKKIEKVKRTRTKRRKHSTSSENESVDESSPNQLVREAEPVVESQESVVKPPQTPTKEDNAEDGPDQVWRVKASEGSSDTGEIHKLKICLTRPPSTPERAERSPRSKRKHSRATSSSDTTSVEAIDEKKKSKHRSKRAHRDSKDGSEKNEDSQGEEHEIETEKQLDGDKQDNEVTQSGTEQTTETPMSTTNEDKINESANSEASQKIDGNTESEVQNKSDADTTVVSPKDETTVVSPKDETTVVSPKDETTVVSSKEQMVPNDSESHDNPLLDITTISETIEKDSPVRKRSVSVDKSEVLELHPEESKIESSDTELNKSKGDDTKKEDLPKETSQDTDQEAKVSITMEKTVSKEGKSDSEEATKTTNESGVVDPENVEKETRKMSTDSEHDKTEKSNMNKEANYLGRRKSREFEHSASTQSTHEETIPNGQAAPIVVNRKRRWGSRPTKLATQKSITISTEVLKDIIPDVKPVEFDEVIEERKHKRVEVSERIERPVLPKIIIDNTENVNHSRKEHNKEDKEENVKVREHHLASNRKISIIKDTDSIIARPPSPPRHKQSCFLYITNLVRPFTLPQLKNLLQRTGRIVENGFWIDRIKSKCYVKYESEDQAVETRHALHGVTWPVSNPKTLQVDFSTEESFDKAKLNEDTDNAQASTIPGTVEDWLREQDMKRERGELEKPWERKAAMREWDVGKNDKDKEKDRLRRDDRPLEKRRHRTPERSPEPARKFKKKEEEAPAKLLDDLFRKTKTTPCIYWLPLSAETIAIKEEQRRQHMAEYERRLLEQRRPHRRH